MKLTFTSLFIGIFLISSGFYIAGKNPIENIIIGIQKFHQSNYQEKIYVQTDTDIYYSGENIWLSIRLLDAGNHTESKLSKVAHLKLFSSEGVELYHNKVLLNKGIGHTDILLSDTLSSGTYQIIAYTEWMKNFSQEFFFHKKLYVVNEQFENNLKPDSGLKLDVAFFPEGGSFIAGKNNKIGFKAINSDGIGVDIKGQLRNDKGEIVDSIKTYKFGMGSFNLIPEKNRTYQFHFTHKNKDYTFNLPTPELEGVKMSVDATESSLVSVEIEITKDNLKELKKVLLVTHSRGIINYAAEGKASSNSIIDIPKSKLSDGINHITVFDQNGNPLLERLIFIKPKNREIIQINGSESTYNQRSKVEFSISSMLDEEANVTISVHDRASINEMNISNYLLLTSDLKGNIENPEFYFQNNDSSLIAADHLMLTQGWTRFNWRDILDNKENVKNYPAENIGPVFRGKLIDKYTNKPITDTLVVLSELNKNPNYLFNRLSSNEEFIFNLHRIYGEELLYVNVLGQDSINQFDLVPFEDYDAFSPKLSSSLFLNDISMNQFVANRNKEKKILDNYRIYKPETSVFWKAVEKEELFRVGQSLESPDYSVNPDEYIELNNLKETIKEIVPGTTMRKIKGQDKIFVYEYEPLASAQRDIAPFNKEPATVFLNGVPIFNEQILFDNLQWSNIKNIDVYIGQYDIADHKFYGFISITTKDIYSKNSMLAYATNVIKFDGISRNKEYYSPKYDIENPFKDRTPDFRHLLYWKPNLKLNAGQPEILSFYTSDLTGDYYISIEGLSSSGIPINQKHHIAVSNAMNQ